MTVYRQIVWFILLLLTCQTVVASADAHTVHQSDTNHQQSVLGDLSHTLDIQHHVGDQHDASFNFPDDSCTHCCHCHGANFTFSHTLTTSQKRATAIANHYHRLYYSITLNVPSRPPLA